MSREVLAPPLLHMGENRCYRVNLVHEDFGNQQNAQKQTFKKAYIEEDMYAEDDYDDENDLKIEELPNSTFQLAMPVAQAFYGGIIGPKGSTKRRIEDETRTDILVPRGREVGRGSSAGGGEREVKKYEEVFIKGKSRSSVLAARRKINLLITSFRKRMRPTHFLGVPLNGGQIRANFNDFRNQILSANLPGIDEALFQDECKIHLTLGVCVLLNDAERAKAVEILQSCRELLTGLQTPFEIKVSGLEIMNDDPSAVRILYACIDSKPLNEFANRMLDPFRRSGLNTEDRDSVKLHMTVMNNRYRKESSAQMVAKNFDAREVLKRFGDFYFGTTQCSEVQLCVMGSAGDSGDFYKSTGTLQF